MRSSARSPTPAMAPGLRVARNMDADPRRIALFLVPFGGRCDQLAVGVTGRDVGQQGCRQLGGLGDLLALFLDGALVGEVAQNALQLGAVGVLQAELARDFPGADLAGIRADKSDDGVPARKAMVGFLASLTHVPFRRSSSRLPWPLAGLAAEVLASALTGARALLTESVFGLAAFFAAAFFAGFDAVRLRRVGVLSPPWPTASSFSWPYPCCWP